MRKALRKLYLQKANRFYNNILSEILGDSIEMNAEVWVCGEAVPFKDRLKGSYAPLPLEQEVGELWDYAWVRLTARIPEEWKNKNIALNLNLERESLIFDREGCPLYGLTTGSVHNTHYKKTIFNIPADWLQEDELEIWVEAAAAHWIGVGRICIHEMNLYEWNEKAWHLSLDTEVLLNLCERLPETSPRRQRILRALHETGNCYAKDHGALDEVQKILQPQLDKPASASDLTTYAVGHAHIDTGWMWPVSTTHGKVRRTFASQVALMEKYPDYVFGASQPQHYAMLKEQYPNLYAKIKDFVKKGQWELQGAMWVESDCNVTSGESLVRQVLHGKNYYMDEFGVDVRNLWLPDVFGYSAAMPQILRRAGVDTFLTQKISWSQFNTFPHHTFLWRGIDGTEILTHFPPEDTYNSMLHPSGMLKAQERFTESDCIDAFATLFGMGDGGGGPKEEVVERGLRMRDFEGTPRVKFAPAQELFDYLHTCKDNLETWSGELYLELHRGTLTTQAHVKQGNRRLENRLREVEFFCSLLPSEDYPIDTLDKLWKELLINQFHDILPGSSVTEVYRDTLAQYESIEAECDELVTVAAAKILEADEASVTYLNTLSCSYTSTIVLPEGWNGATLEDGSAVATQAIGNKTLATVEIPALGMLSLKKAEAEDVETAPGKDLVLENDLVRYAFDKNGTLTSAFDKETQREALAEGEAGNVLTLYEDVPQNWEAWDIDIYYEDQAIETASGESAEAIASGPVCNALRFKMKIGQSTIEQVVKLESNTKRLDFETTVDWDEARKMLRVAFPVDIHVNEATYDIQFGYVKRPTHRNTSWDMAKFEVAAHKYVDLSEADYGVALLNDSKYGHKVHNNVLDLHLLRAPHYPDEGRKLGFTDKGRHSFTYALLPHTGDLPHCNVQEEAWMLNRKPLAVAGFKASKTQLPFTIESNGVV
ncbi:MAG: alpha-mannosidase, partial [Candidatus Sumerlaeota bacterium]